MPRPPRGSRVAASRSQSGASSGSAQRCCAEHQVVGLSGDRHEVEAERARRGEDAEAAVGPAGRDRGGDREVGVLLALVAVDLPGSIPRRASSWSSSTRVPAPRCRLT